MELDECLIEPSGDKECQIELISEDRGSLIKPTSNSSVSGLPLSLFFLFFFFSARFDEKIG